SAGKTMRQQRTQAIANPREIQVMKPTIHDHASRNAERSTEEFDDWQNLIRSLRSVAAACVAAWLLSSDALAATFRFASSSNRIYVESVVSATLSDIKAALPNAPLDLVDPANGIWLLRANLFIVDGSVVVLHGTAIGGDVNEFRLQSNNSSASNSFVSV